MSVSHTSLTLDDSVISAVQGQLMVVADGMGGHAAGEQASRLAITHFIHRLLDTVHWFFGGANAEDLSPRAFASTISDSTMDGDETIDTGIGEGQIEVDDPREQEFLSELGKALKEVHACILSASAQHQEQRGMGTTFTMAIAVWPRLYVLHAGDSRCYLIRDDEVQQLTTDHTLARQMVEAGGLNPEDEANSKWSNVLWNVLGGRPDGELIAEVRRVILKPGDTIVLCSDGLHRYINFNTLASVFASSESSEEACKRLIGLANEAGGEDNITVIVSQPKADDIGKTTWVDDFDTVLPH